MSEKRNNIDSFSAEDARSSDASFLRTALHIKEYQQKDFQKALVVGVSDKILNYLHDVSPDMDITVGKITTLPDYHLSGDGPFIKTISIDTSSLDFPDDTFDIVVCSNVFSHLPQYRNLMRELLRVLKPGMPFIAIAQHSSRFGFFPIKKTANRTFSLRELAVMFQNFHMTGIKTNGRFSETAAVFGKKHMLRVKHSGVVHLPSFEDSKGGMLVTAEFGKTVPFDAKRVYVISNVTGKDAVRGGHAHKGLDQVIFCVSGSFELRIDDGSVHQKVMMKNNGYGIRLGPKLWHSMRKFSRDCVILVFASDFYDESDYLRKYDEFMTYIAEHP